MNIRRFFYLILALALPLSALANPLVDAGKEQTNRSYSKNSTADSRRKTFLPGSEARWLKSEMSGIEGMAVETSSTNATMYAPMAGFADIAYSKAYANQLSAILGSPMVLYNATMQLTEPAVAAAVHNTALQNYGALQARYLAEENYMRQLERDPETKQIMQRAYYECVANLIRDRKSGATDDTATWIEAQSICMADRIKSIDSVNASARNFDTIAGKTGMGYNFFFEPSWDPTSSGSDENLIRLTDYFVNQSNANNPSPITKSSLSFNAFEIRNAFRELFGDYMFELDKNNSGARSMSRQLKYTYIPPTIPRQEWMKKQAEGNYELMVRILTDRCNSQAANQDTASLNGNLYCTKNHDALRPDFVRLSFVDYDFDCTLVESIFKIFTYDNPKLANSSDVRDCSVISAFSYGDLVTYDPNAAPNAKGKAGHMYMKDFAEGIAVGQLYLIARNAHDLIQNLTGVNAYFAKKFGKQLLNNFIGNNELSTANAVIIQNLKELKYNIDNYNSYYGGAAARKTRPNT